VLNLFLRLFLLLLAGLLGSGVVASQFASAASTSASTFNSYLYCGEQWDADLGLYFNRARYLNVATGRFWSMDTYEGAPSDPVSLHKYLYAQGEPANACDPSGFMRVSSNKDYGKIVHDRIGDAFEAEDFNRFSDRPVSQILGILSVAYLTTSRPDLTQLPTRTLPGQVFEIKPDTQFIQGRAQLEWYLFLLRTLDPRRRKWEAGSWTVFLPPPIIPIKPMVCAFISPPIDGVILYYIEDWRPNIAAGLAVGVASLINDVSRAIMINTLAPVG
jgi:RHS repeat-associated protein